MNEQELRELALAAVKKKREFWQHLLVYVMVNAFLVAIWAATSRGFFWPMFPLIGWGIGIGAHAMDAYASPISERQVEKEVERLRRSA